MALNRKLSYHLGQFDKPYRSTELFYEWLANKDCFNKSKKIIDVGAGAGSNLAYFAKRNPQIQCVGVDNDQELIMIGKKIIEKLALNNIILQCQDLFKLKKQKLFFETDGVISLQTLSWLPHYEKAMRSILRLNPRWFAASSLFYEGEINAFITLHDYYRPTKNKEYVEYYYNVYSLGLFKKYLAKFGYKKFSFKRYDIDIDLPCITRDLGTYTEMLTSGRRLQMSGPLLMPWYFVYAEK